MPYTNSRIASRAAAVCALAAACALAACAGPEPEPVVQPAPGTRVALTDAEIASTVTTANTAEVQTGQLALQKSQNAAVRQFAQWMITDHTQLNQSIVAAHRDMDRMDGTGPLSQPLATSARRTMQVLQQLQGAQFDRA